MKISYLVFNVAKTAFDVDGGLKFGPGGLTAGGVYGNMKLEPTLEAARQLAAQYANSGTVGAIFELTEAHIVRPQPVEIITSRS